MSHQSDAQPSSVGSSPSVADRRRSPRHQHEAPAWLSCDNTAEGACREEVQAVDLSQHGVGFRCRMVPAIGSRYCIEIGSGPHQLLSEVRIINARPTDDGVFHVGAEFC